MFVARGCGHATIVNQLISGTMMRLMWFADYVPVEIKTHQQHDGEATSGMYWYS